ncbi:hypothetical protein CEXT_156521 [Caerostris extrusa]|uniref:Uncharacterized protein n=1 Tax=Caerostris extrusa TaxID=172846 RepID=A0AAV4TWZ3_CAEEX|nr:hypothetical protein CEXT_156521 [Caerostris extrusa]
MSSWKGETFIQEFFFIECLLKERKTGYRLRITSAKSLYTLRYVLFPWDLVSVREHSLYYERDRMILPDAISVKRAQIQVLRGIGASKCKLLPHGDFFFLLLEFEIF